MTDEATTANVGSLIGGVAKKSSVTINQIANGFTVSIGYGTENLFSFTTLEEIYSKITEYFSKENK